MSCETIQDAEEIRWQIVKAMLNDFPRLRKRVEEHLLKEQKQNVEAQPKDMSSADMA